MAKKSSVLKYATAIAVSALTITSLAACSSSSNGASGSEGKTLSFVSYTGGAAGEKYVALIKGFEAKYPGIKVNIDVVPGDNTYDNLVKTRIQGGKAPDLFEILNGVPGEVPYVKAGMLTDLSTQPWVKTLLPAAADAANSTSGKTYSMITALNSEGVFYNKAIFQKEGVAIPTNWTDFLAAITKFNSAGITPLAVGAKDGWPLMVQAQEMAASDPTFAKSGNAAATSLADGAAPFSKNAAWIKVVTDFQSLVKDQAFSKDASGVTWPSSATDFASGKAAMLIQGDFAIPAVRAANPKVDLGYFALPYVSAGHAPTVSTNYGGMLAIPKNAKNAQLAEKFLDYLTEPSVMTTYLNTAVALPTIKGADPKIDPAVQEILPALNKRSGDTSQSGLNPATTAALQSGLQGLIAGTGSPQTVLADMDQAQSK